MSRPIPSQYTSRLAGFHGLDPQGRLERLETSGVLDRAAREALESSLSLERANLMTENVIGVFGLPLSVATNFRIDGQERLLPMAVEESSVVAAAGKAAKLARLGGGFATSATGNVMTGQIQLMGVPDPAVAHRQIHAAKAELLNRIPVSPSVQAAGGGPLDLELRHLPLTDAGPMLLVHLTYDVADAMGANLLNTALELLVELLPPLTGGRAVMGILTNLTDRRLATARVLYPWHALADDRERALLWMEDMVSADALARVDPYRAATHNKGIMNGVESLILATGNDWRAAAAAAHAWAARHGTYGGLTHWSRIDPREPLPLPWAERTWDRDPRPALYGQLTLPLALGVVGGATKVHPTARAALRLLGQPNAAELARIACAVGLAQNFAALYALTGPGIQAGHMRMHARQVALAAGVPPHAIFEVTSRMVEENTVTAAAAACIWKQQQTETAQP